MGGISPRPTFLTHRRGGDIVDIDEKNRRRERRKRLDLAQFFVISARACHVFVGSALGPAVD